MYDVDYAKEQLQHILNGLEYRSYYNQREGFVSKWWNKLVEWLADKLIAIFKTTETSQNISEIILVIIITLIVLFMIFGLFIFLRHIQRRRRYRSQQPLSTWDKIDWTYENHLAEAKKLELENNLQHATRHRFLALLLFFDERGYLEKKIWKTNVDYYLELKQGSKERANTFLQLARTFDDVVYGEHNINKKDYEVFRQQTIPWLKESR
ncbi:uncharacterized protein with PQ loop repeat [Cerasibacillus quisquiliarum]|uniref:Protein-glutamine gamma-glutamyltransferase-like C-terminal domain-containing protein n=1 Tax=Cerasibacillus quisquiliarum TaxID=227865 RepID=A0A511UZA3_9BACI|nr:DUF4129 domain-containing protein [Cerasibacillus quisquiliarum]MBB5147009.1 uncharacterized protein with PQ loop repeat [Cerasibacillus quisquiliarum]GEN31919.1 hypothetical protein CQU01_21570 [Cerasibacillus quisquiliarum]